MMLRVFSILTILVLATPVFAELTCEERISMRSSQEADELRRRFILDYADRDFSTPEKNEAWIQAALSSPSFHRIFLQVENSTMKALNKKFGNKDFVSALTNFHKELFLKEFEREFRDLRGDHYSDFKTERHFMSGEADPFTLARMEKAFLSATGKFYADDRIRKMVRSGDLENGWFSLGIALSADESSLAAKYARNTKQKIAHFWQQEVQAFFQAKFDRVRQLNEDLMALPRLSSLIERKGRTSGFKLEVFAAARKADKPEDLHRALIQQFKSALITENDAVQIKEFSDLSDIFTPPLLIAKGEKLMIHEAPYGAITLDFLGLGAENIKATAKALVEADSLANAVKLARENEQKVTAEFIRSKDVIRREFMAFFDGQATIRFSGDDAVIVPQREFLATDINQFMKRLAQMFPRPFFRMATITKDGAKQDSSGLTTQGEEIEKALRTKVLEKSGIDLARNLTMNTLLWDDADSRKVVMIAGMKRPLSSIEKRDLKEAFQAAVKAVENEFRIKGSSLSLVAEDIFAIAE